MRRLEGLRIWLARLLIALAGVLVATVAMGLRLPAIWGAADAESPKDTAPIRQIHLYATDGRMLLPNGKDEVYIWGYSLKNEPGSAEFPSPTITVNEGDVVEVTLTNIGPKLEGAKKVAHTIHFHGLDTDQENDGVPHTSHAILVGESFTYRFIAAHAGTYFYHCHVDTIEHMQMGMHGAFIVKAKGGLPEAWTGGPRYDKAYLLQLNEIDPVWHQAVEAGEAYDRTDYHPRYWTINGKSFPDTENDPASMIEGRVGDTILVRLLNSGYESHNIHFHGQHVQIIATDGRPLPSPIEKDTIQIGPGERYDILMKLYQAGDYPIHSHNITDNTNNGEYPGGMHTMMRVLPALSDVSIKLTAGKQEAWVNGIRQEWAHAPLIQNGQLYVPLRPLLEAAQVKMSVEAGTGAVILTMKANELKLTAGQKQAVYNGKSVDLSAPPIVMKGSVLIPMQVAISYMGAKLEKGSSGEWTVTLPMLPPSPSTVADQEMAAVGTEPTASPSPVHEGHGESDAPSETTGGSGGTVKEDAVTVNIDSSTFSVKDLTIKAGTTVTWVNQDDVAHTVTDLNDHFDSKTILASGSWSFTFNEIGSYTYYCAVHPSMQGSVAVE